MLRACFVVVVIWLASGSSIAVAASCQDYCVKTRCAAGNVSYNQNSCLAKCMQGCALKHKK